MRWLLEFLKPSENFPLTSRCNRRIRAHEAKLLNFWGMTNDYRIFALQDVAATCIDLTRFDRIRLHLRCLIRDHKYRWHLAGVWRELCLRQIEIEAGEHAPDELPTAPPRISETLGEFSFNDWMNPAH